MPPGARDGAVRLPGRPDADEPAVAEDELAAACARRRRRPARTARSRCRSRPPRSRRAPRTPGPSPPRRCRARRSRAGGTGTAARAPAGPEASRTCFWSQVQASAPSTTWTKTTGESGRKVPVPRAASGTGGRPRRPRPGAPRSRAAPAASTSVGGSRVTWVGMPWAAGSPKPARRSWSRLPCGSGTAIDTPSVTVPTSFSCPCRRCVGSVSAVRLSTVRPRRAAGRRNRSDVQRSGAVVRRAVVACGGGQCFAGRKPTRSYVWARVSAATARAFSAPLARIESSVSGSSRYSWVRSRNGRHEVHHDLGEVRLQRTVALALVLLLQFRDAGAGEGGVDA